MFPFGPRQAAQSCTVVAISEISTFGIVPSEISLTGSVLSQPEENDKQHRGKEKNGLHELSRFRKG